MRLRVLTLLALGPTLGLLGAAVWCFRAGRAGLGLVWLALLGGWISALAALLSAAAMLGPYARR